VFLTDHVNLVKRLHRNTCLFWTGRVKGASGEADRTGTAHHNRGFNLMRENITAAMKQALKDKDQVALSTMRLIMAALKDRDIAARGNGNPDGISDDDILGMLQTMIKQRTESAKMYRDGGRPELADAEDAEIFIIQGFLPAQLSADEMQEAVARAIAETGAASVKDMGQVMGYLKGNFAGQMDFSAASQAVKAALMAKN
jgi:uncharacterized protein YqeY